MGQDFVIAAAPQANGENGIDDRRLSGADLGAPFPGPAFAGSAGCQAQPLRARAGSAAETHLLAAVLDQVGCGIVVCRATGTTLYANRQARSLASACGLRLGAHVPVRVASEDETSRLLLLVRATCAGEAGGCTRLTAPLATDSLAAQISALKVGQWKGARWPNGLALVALRRLGGQTVTDTRWFMNVFGLTKAEAKVLPALLAGKSTAEVACALGVSAHTVRSHVRAVLAKTQTVNLRALAALVSGAIAGAGTTHLAPFGTPAKCNE